MADTPEIIIADVEKKAALAKEAAHILAQASTKEKNAALMAIADALGAHEAEILAANAQDMENGRVKGLSEALLDRLQLTPKRIADMAEGLRKVATLTDPVGETTRGWRRPNGLEIRRVRVPLGVIGLIYEARPNVTIEAVGLCLKSGNALLLRGGSEAIASNICLAKIAAEAAQANGMPEGCIQIIESTDRIAAEHMMSLREYIDVLIPRGGASLIQSVVKNAKVPVIETGEGNCHLYVDAAADLEIAQRVAVNAKCSRPSVCNAIETMLVHEAVAEKFLPKVAIELHANGVELRGDARVCALVPQAKLATEDDWDTEYLALILAIRVVSGINEAIWHINKHSTRHSEAIITKDLEAARRFIAEIDSCTVFVNASTRFCDGGEFGLGAEIGISTQKLHARGPMGLEELTSYKYVVAGQGQVRG
jgi:glutamate-5-semialdehyde dehydrogenase